MNLREGKHWSYGAHSSLFPARGQRLFLIWVINGDWAKIEPGFRDLGFHEIWEWMNAGNSRGPSSNEFRESRLLWHCAPCES
jgi:hypothetical protein